MQYFVKRGEKVQGPFSREKLVGFAKSKRISSSDLVATDKFGPFDPLKTIWDSITGIKEKSPDFNSCGSCGAPVFKSATTCPKCASPIRAMPQLTVPQVPEPAVAAMPTPAAEPSPSTKPNLTACPDCGATVSRKAAACPQCGSPMGQPDPLFAQQPMMLQPMQKAAKKKSGNKKKIILISSIAGGVLIVAIIAATLIFDRIALMNDFKLLHELYDSGKVDRAENLAYKLFKSHPNAVMPEMEGYEETGLREFILANLKLRYQKNTNEIRTEQIEIKETALRARTLEEARELLSRVQYLEQEKVWAAARLSSEVEKYVEDPSRLNASEKHWYLGIIDEITEVDLELMATTGKDIHGAAVIDGNVKVRLPTVIGDEYSMRYGPSDEFRKARVYGMDFPGFKASFIGDKEGEGTWLPVQAYFYVTPAGSESIVDFKKETKQIVADKNSGYSERWEDLTVAGFDGKERVWSKLALLGNQEFMVADGNGSTKREQLPAQMEMMVTTNGSQNLMVIFRSPAGIFDSELQMSTIQSLRGFHE